MASPPERHLTAERRRTLAAAAERVLPGEGGRPGAREAGVADHVESLLDRPRLAAWRGLLEEGLDRLEAEARRSGSADFAEAAPEVRDRLLRDLQERSDARGRAFVDKLVLLCLEGFLGDPAHGGNRDGVGWRAVGAGRPAVGRPRPARGGP